MPDNSLFVSFLFKFAEKLIWPNGIMESFFFTYVIIMHDSSLLFLFRTLHVSSQMCSTLKYEFSKLMSGNSEYHPSSQLIITLISVYFCTFHVTESHCVPLVISFTQSMRVAKWYVFEIENFFVISLFPWINMFIKRPKCLSTSVSRLWENVKINVRTPVAYVSRPS